jgi:hypothetical protein
LEKRARERAALPQGNEHRVRDEQKCDHQGVVAPSGYHFDHDSFSTFIAALLYISGAGEGLSQVSKPE